MYEAESLACQAIRRPRMPPASINGDRELAQAARRELLEETGYDAAEMHLLGGGPTSAGLSNEVVTFFRASGLRRLNHGGGVEGEEIVVHELRMDELDARQSGDRAGEGKMIDPKIYAGLWLAQQEESS